MPPFYYTDNLQTWLRVVIDESLESYETNEEKLAYIEIVTNINSLKQTCEEAIETQLQATNGGCDPFMQALMNTIDWEEMLDDVTNDMEGEKDAIEQEEYSFKKLYKASLCEDASDTTYVPSDIDEWLRDSINGDCGEDDGDSYLKRISNIDTLKTECRKHFFEEQLSIDNPKAVDYLMKTVAWHKLLDDVATKIGSEEVNQNDVCIICYRKNRIICECDP